MRKDARAAKRAEQADAAAAAAEVAAEPKEAIADDAAEAPVDNGDQE